MSERKTLVLSALFVFGLVIHMTSGQDSTTVAPDPTATTPADSGSNTTTPGGGNETQAGGSSTTPAPVSSGNNEGPDTTVDYCEPSLCPHGHLHVACNASMVSILSDIRYYFRYWN